jgi:hypothetical protein
MPSYHHGLPQGHDLRCNDLPRQGGHHSCLQEVLDWIEAVMEATGVFIKEMCILYAYQLSLKVSAKSIHPNCYFYCFECVHRVCPNLSSAPCRSQTVNSTLFARLTSFFPIS